MNAPHSHSAGIDGRTFAIGVLSVTACVLLVGFVLVSFSPPQALAIGQSDRSGDYLMVTQQLTTSQEGVAVVDAAAKVMIIYAYDYNRKAVEILGRVPLDRLRKPPEAGQEDRPDRRRRR